MPATEINLNDTNPPALPGYINGKWQGVYTGVDPETGIPIRAASVCVPLGGGLTEVTETPAGAMNGVNVTFTLANAPSPAGSLSVFLNGVYQGPYVSVSGASITYTVAPKSTDDMRAQYTH
jgi:hypothetical protein